jgi:hypothetical protein
MSLHEFIKRLYRAQSMHLFMNETQKVYNLHKVLAFKDLDRLLSAYRASNYSHAFCRDKTRNLCLLCPCTHEPDFSNAAFNAILKRSDISIVCQTDVTLKIVCAEEK